MVVHLLTMRWVIGTIPHGGHIELFLIPSGAPQLVSVVCVILSVGWYI